MISSVVAKLDAHVSQFKADASIIRIDDSFQTTPTTCRSSHIKLSHLTTPVVGDSKYHLLTNEHRLQ
jgi:hypothetical protein